MERRMPSKVCLVVRDFFIVSFVYSLFLLFLTMQKKSGTPSVHSFSNILYDSLLHTISPKCGKPPLFMVRLLMNHPKSPVNLFT